MNQETMSWKYWLIKLGLILSLGLLMSAIFRLMVIRGGYYRSLARDNKVYETEIPAGRGKILDRKGRVVGQSVYQYFRLNGDEKVYEEGGDFKGYKFEGKDLAYDLKRQYPYGESMAFVSGYVAKADGEDINLDNCKVKLDQHDNIGRGGVEEYFDCELRGEDGRRLIEVDAKGNYVRELGRQEPMAGEDLNLTVDAFWQDKIFKMIQGKKVVVIMSEPATGKIIAMVSSPSFDPNHFSYMRDSVAISKYLSDRENLPLLNRAIAARYHPGSVFKVVVSTAGMEDKLIDRNTLIEDTGSIKVGDYSYNNWLWTKRGETDGMVDVVKALQRSNDIYFYRLGEKLGPDLIKKWALSFGYGEKTGVELIGELPGIVPDDEWKRQVKGERWYLGNSYHLAIGQGDLDVTPLQVNLMTNVIANNGVRCDLTLNKDKEKNCVDLKISRDTREAVSEGMTRACVEGGTAWPLFNFKTPIACKTGTAEVGDGSKDSHAWLTAYAPIDNPEISITVMVERGGEGSDVAAPIVGDILKEWFEETDTIVPRYDENGKVIYSIEKENE
jgi:penicillin-binding protein 2